MCDSVMVDAPAPLCFSEAGSETAEPMAERTGRLLEAGDYPDKNLTLTAGDLDALAARFTADLAEDGTVPVKVEHVDSALDPLGAVRRVWREGDALWATFAFPSDLAAFLRRRGAAKLSVGLTRDPLRLREVSLVLKPRVLSATLMSEPTPPAPLPRKEGGGGEEPREAGGGKDAEIVRLRAELASRDVEAHLAAFKAQGRIVPASEGPARALLAAVGEAIVTLSDGPEPIARVFKRFLEAQPPVVLLSEAAPSGGASEAGGEGAFTQYEHTFLSERLGVDPALVAARLRAEREAREAQEKENSHAR